MHDSRHYDLEDSREAGYLGHSLRKTMGFFGPEIFSGKGGMTRSHWFLILSFRYSQQLSFTGGKKRSASLKY